VIQLFVFHCRQPNLLHLCPPPLVRHLTRGYLKKDAWSSDACIRRGSQRPSIDRMALDFRPSSFRRVTRVSPSSRFRVFSPLSALTAGSCPLTLSSSGKPLTQGCPLNPSHLRWGCCINYCGAPDAGGGRLQAFVRRCGYERRLPAPPGTRLSWCWDKFARQ
jgi:hypothetical protein